MEPTYNVLGSDGNQYGPVTTEQLRGWIREGRVTGDTQIWRSDTSGWVAASALPELGISPVSPVAAAGAAVPVVVPGAPLGAPAMSTSADPELERRIKSGAGWFYWIAAFSIINSVLTITGSQWGFALGLGITAIIDAIAAGAGGASKAVAIILNVVAAGLLVLFGFFAGKRHAWAFVIGMLLLALDAALTGLLRMWLSLGLHLFALFCIFAGFKASRAVR